MSKVKGETGQAAISKTPASIAKISGGIFFKPIGLCKYKNKQQINPMSQRYNACNNAYFNSLLNFSSSAISAGVMGSLFSYLALR